MLQAIREKDLILATSKRERPHLVPVAALPPQTVCVVVPVYRGAKTLSSLVEEINALTSQHKTAEGVIFNVTEIVLVWDGAVDDSASVMERLAKENSFVRTVWLSRNFGQHAATLAGIAGSTADWVVTLDEDGQHNPADIPELLEQALESNQQLVYGMAANTAPHGFVRNTGSKVAHWAFSRLTGDKAFNRFSSFRLIRGDIARSLAAFCGNGVYLDAALNWVAAESGTVSVVLRQEGRPASSYNLSKLVEHFSRLIFCSKKTPLRLVLAMGVFTVLLSFGLAGYALFQKYAGNVPVQGWTSLFILISFFFGILMLAIGILAEYIGLILSLSMGKPLFLIQPTAPKSR